MVCSFISYTFFQASRMDVFSMNIYSLLIFCSLTMHSIHYFWALSSSITLTCSVWRNSLGSETIISPTFLKALIVGLSSSASMLKAPSGSTTTQRSKEQTNSTIATVPSAKIVEAALLFPAPPCSLVVWIYSLCRTVWMELYAYFCYCSNYCNSCMVVPLTLSHCHPRHPLSSWLGLTMT